MSFAESQIVYRDLAGPWGSLRLQVGGRDVTTFRGAPAQIGGYQLTDPYGYGPADFSFPQITSLEVDGWGVGDLSWFGMGKEVRLIQVDDAGAFVRIVWRGFAAQMNPTLGGTNVHCDGWASGRMAALPHHPRLFNSVKDLGSWLHDACARSGVTARPVYGLDTGIRLDPRSEGGTELSYCDFLLSRSLRADGSRLTLMPDGLTLTQQWRDTSTIHFSAFNGAAGFDIDPVRDLLEEPTTITGQGREPATGDEPESLVYVNRRDPGLKQGDAPTFPGTLSPGDSGDDVNTLQSKLQGMGYMSREDTIGGFNDETEDAVKALQADAGLSETGIVNSATWDALWDLSDTGLSLRQSFIAPFAELDAVKKWLRTSNGSRAGRNPGYDPSRIEVGLHWDFGVTKKSRARKMARRHLAQIHESPVWVATMEFRADVVVGNHGHGTAPEGIMSRLDIEPGMNVRVRNFNDATTFHIAVVNVDSDLTVRCAADTKGRDALVVGQILQANAESRQDPARRYNRQTRGTDANHAVIEFSETGGEVYNKVVLPANEWTEVPVVAGQSGTLNKVMVQLTNTECEFVVGLAAKRQYASGWKRIAANPFTSVNQTRLQNKIDRRQILGLWGDDDQPGGYAPGTKTGEDGTATGDPVTGLFQDSGGLPYWTIGQPVIWLAIYPKQACELKPQRVLWPVLEAGT